jgi:hypothetical protein
MSGFLPDPTTEADGEGTHVDTQAALESEFMGNGRDKRLDRGDVVQAENPHDRGGDDLI